ncbi:MAG TPA: adenylate/guanylate cyclase domain-containing protein [Gammaproteobacteria bacterium]|nr:adenylate/guanylate cyclase domain-containing protein [Gammaproteobacteria bacterium]
MARLRRPLVLGCVLGAAGLLTSWLPGTATLEQALGLGLLFAVRGPLPSPTDVAVVAVSRDAARAVGQTTELDTWPRSLHADLLERLTASGASAVAFDLTFNERRSGDGDALFAGSIERAGNVVLLEWTESDVKLVAGSEAWLEVRKPPLPELKAAALGSAPFVLPAVPVEVGQFWTFGRASDDMPALPVVALQAHLLPHYDEFVALVERARAGATAQWPRTRAAVQAQRELESTMAAIRRTFLNDASLGAATKLALERGKYSATETAALRVLLDMYAGPASRFLNFYGPALSVRTLPYDQALKGTGGDIAGTLLIVGLSESRQPEQQDDFISVFSQNTGVNLSGAELGATAVANLLEGRALAPLPVPMQGALIVALGLAFGFLVGRATITGAAVAAALAGALYFSVAYWQFASHYLWLPLVVPLLLQLPVSFVTAVWWSYREVNAQRERVRTALGYYVPRSLVSTLTEETLTAGADSQLLHGTCLVTDAENYTSVAERLQPAALAVLVNEYYQTIFRVVEAHGGEISDTAGDSMVAVWASAKPDAGARLRAARASLAILDAVEQFNRAHADAPLPTRVGLETGEMLLGNIGGEQRYEYRAVGDIVNTASRIQGLNPLLGTRVLLSATTLADIDLPARDVGTFLLRGKRLPVGVFEPIAAAGGRLNDESIEEFAAALAAFRRGDWQSAQDAFEALAARLPSDGPSRYYDAMSRAMRLDPPVSWTGVVRITAK